ncbi:Photosystem I reaction center subunit III [Geitlerinema sp. PCC 9228]|uniref:Photosystem I reaction center subunit III n=1 Tax=Geitlerinema sp. PCC 9228 TaxID=111611 RepID=UPI0008F9B3A6|nr:Photosystem I reaction center subunit III [Geitlerinema sp. PCC 9228]
MKKLIATLMLAVSLMFAFAPAASAIEYGNLTRCSENPAFQARAERATTEADRARFERYSSLLCGDDGLPHLIADGNLSHAREFLIPSLLFLYIAGWIGWVGRKYLQMAQKEKKPEDKEYIIDVPAALQCAFSGFIWPLEAIKEATSGELAAKDEEIPISPR